MAQFLALVITGAVSGAIYSLIAAGVVLNYSLSGVFNFAYGAIAFSVAFTFYEFNTGLGWPVWNPWLNGGQPLSAIIASWSVLLRDGF